jgi:hypothetical protein
MRCVTQHHRISSDPTRYLHAPHVERRCEACLPGLNWVVCLVELKGATRVSHNTQRAVAALSIRLMQAWSYAMVPSVSTPPAQHLHASRVLPIDTRVALPLPATRTDPPASALSNDELPQVHCTLVKGRILSSLQAQWTNDPLGDISGVQEGLGVLA